MEQPTRTVSILGTQHQITNPTFIDSLTCPTCGATECHPKEAAKILIRGFKIDNLSQCLVCAGYVDPVTLEKRPGVTRSPSIPKPNRILYLDDPR
jgi:hypothetical protein